MVSVDVKDGELGTPSQWAPLSPASAQLYPRPPPQHTAHGRKRPRRGCEKRRTAQAAARVQLARQVLPPALAGWGQSQPRPAGTPPGLLVGESPCPEAVPQVPRPPSGCGGPPQHAAARQRTSELLSRAASAAASLEPGRLDGDAPFFSRDVDELMALRTRTDTCRTPPASWTHASRASSKAAATRFKFWARLVDAGTASYGAGVLQTLGKELLMGDRAGSVYTETVATTGTSLSSREPSFIVPGMAECVYSAGAWFAAPAVLGVAGSVAAVIAALSAARQWPRALRTTRRALAGRTKRCQTGAEALRRWLVSNDMDGHALAAAMKRGDPIPSKPRLWGNSDPAGVYCRSSFPTPPPTRAPTPQPSLPAASQPVRCLTPNELLQACGVRPVDDLPPPAGHQDEPVPSAAQSTVPWRQRAPHPVRPWSAAPTPQPFQVSTGCEYDPVPASSFRAALRPPPNIARPPLSVSNRDAADTGEPLRMPATARGVAERGQVLLHGVLLDSSSRQNVERAIAEAWHHEEASARRLQHFKVQLRAALRGRRDDRRVVSPQLGSLSSPRRDSPINLDSRSALSPKSPLSPQSPQSPKSPQSAQSPKSPQSAQSVRSPLSPLSVSSPVAPPYDLAATSPDQSTRAFPTHLTHVSPPELAQSVLFDDDSPANLPPVMMIRLKRWAAESRRRLAVKKRDALLAERLQEWELGIQQVRIRTWRVAALARRWHRRRWMRRAWDAWSAVVAASNQQKVRARSRLEQAFLRITAFKCFHVWQRYTLVMGAARSGTTLPAPDVFVPPHYHYIQQWSEWLANFRQAESVARGGGRFVERHRLRRCLMALRLYADLRKDKAQLKSISEAHFGEHIVPKIMQRTFAKMRRVVNGTLSRDKYVQTLVSRSFGNWHKRFCRRVELRCCYVTAAERLLQQRRARAFTRWRQSWEGTCLLRYMGTVRGLQRKCSLLPAAFLLAGLDGHATVSMCFRRWAAATRRHRRFVTFASRALGAWHTQLLQRSIVVWRSFGAVDWDTGEMAQDDDSEMGTRQRSAASSMCLDAEPSAEVRPEVSESRRPTMRSRRMASTVSMAEALAASIAPVAPRKVIHPLWRERSSSIGFIGGRPHRALEHIRERIRRAGSVTELQQVSDYVEQELAFPKLTRIGRVAFRRWARLEQETGSVVCVCVLQAMAVHALTSKEIDLRVSYLRQTLARPMERAWGGAAGAEEQDGPTFDLQVDDGTKTTREAAILHELGSRLAVEAKRRRAERELAQVRAKEELRALGPEFYNEASASFNATTLVDWLNSRIVENRCIVVHITQRARWVTERFEAEKAMKRYVQVMYSCRDTDDVAAANWQQKLSRTGPWPARMFSAAEEGCGDTPMITARRSSSLLAAFTTPKPQQKKVARLVRDAVAALKVLCVRAELRRKPPFTRLGMSALITKPQLPRQVASEAGSPMAASLGQLNGITAGDVWRCVMLKGARLVEGHAMLLGCAPPPFPSAAAAPAPAPAPDAERTPHEELSKAASFRQLLSPCMSLARMKRAPAQCSAALVVERPELLARIVRKDAETGGLQRVGTVGTLSPKNETAQQRGRSRVGGRRFDNSARQGSETVQI